VVQDATTRTISVGKGTDGTLVDLTGTAGARKLTGVSAGTLSATSADAVNGSQLFATNQNVTKNATDITAVGGRVTTTEGDIATIKTDATSLGGRVTTAEGNITNLQNTVNNINGGTAGLVQQDATSRTITVAKGSDGTLVDFTGTAGARKLTGVSAGTLSAASTDAVNGAQLNTTNANVTTNATNIAALGGRVTTTEGDISTIKTDVAASKGDISTIKTDVATSKGDIANIKTDVTNIDGRVTTVEGNVTNLTTQINSGSVGLVKQDAATNVITVAKDTAGTRVDFTGTAGARTLTGLSSGALSATSTDAINGSQLFTTNQNVTALGGRVTTAEGNITNLGSQLTTTNTNVTNLGSQLTTTNSNVSNLQTTVNNINSGTVGLVQQDATTRAISVAKDTDGRLVHFAGTTGARRLDGVDIGTLSATSTDAVNGSELYATNLNVTQNAADISTLGGRVTTAEGNISTIKTDVAKNEGDISTIKTDVATSKGDISAIKTDMANSQGDISNIRTDVTNIGGRVTNVEGSVTNITKQINSGSIGLVQQAAAGGKLTVGAGIDGNEVNFANNAGRARKLTRVAAGTGAEDAVNVSQLKSVTDGLGGGASIDPATGLVTGPTYSLTNADGSLSSVHTVGDALTNLDGRVYGNTNRINSLASQIGSGSVGLVQQASAGQKLTVGKDTDGNEVSFANAAGQARKLSGIAAGAVSATSTDAINGSQLQAVNQSVATALGGGSAVKADGTISAPTYSVTNADGSTAKVSGVEGAIGNLDGRVHDNTARIDNVETNVSKLSSKIDGAVGLVQQAAPGQQLTVGKANDGTSVNFTGTAGDRALTGVAAGKADNDAVNVSQLKAAGLVGANGELKPVLGYDGPDKNSVTLGGGNGGQPVAIHNVAAGVSDNDAVNVSQLNARLQAQTSAVLSQANGYTDDRFKSALREIDTLRSDVDDRFHAQDARIDRMGAMGTAMASMTSSMSGVARDNRVGVGAGESNGRLAMAVGYQRAFRNGGATLTAGASFTDEDSSVGIGGGFGW
jgi:autotransporter adhesin